MESLAHLEALCEVLYMSQDSAERAHAESTLKCFSVNPDYITQCQYILDNALTPYALMLASSSLLKQVMEQSLSLQLRLDIRNIPFKFVNANFCFVNTRFTFYKLCVELYILTSFLSALIILHKTVEVLSSKLPRLNQ